MVLRRERLDSVARISRLVEEARWRVAEVGGEGKDFQAYIRRYPNGIFAAEAQRRINRLTMAEAAAKRTASVENDTQIANLGVGTVPILRPEKLELSGDPIGEVEGIEWMTSAASQGHPWAQRDVGVRLASGDRGERSPQEAARYLGLAAASDDGCAAATARNKLAEILSPSDRVRTIQHWLAQLGYDPGPTDGLGNTKTKAAIATFLADRDLTSLKPEAPDLIVHLAPLIEPWWSVHNI